LRDGFREEIFLGEGGTHTATAVDDPDIDAEIEVLPLGVVGRSMRPSLIFRPWTDLIPQNYDQAALKVISDFYWEK
jgi:hypothetical protein